jgi:4-aminobutyrate aminotransferase-like enzyme
MAECLDVERRDDPFDVGPYRRELEGLKQQLGRKLSILITEPYLGGGGSYHPPAAYLQTLQCFCRDNDMTFILHEIQSNFGRTRERFAFEAYGLEPDLVVLGKSLGNGVPVAAVAGKADILGALEYSEGSDTWSANPLCCAAVLATLEEFASNEVLDHSRRVSAIIEQGLCRLKELPFIAHVRGEKQGMVWGVETQDFASRPAAEWANAVVLAAYMGDGVSTEGIHLLGPLAKKVIRFAPPLVITETQAIDSMNLLYRSLDKLLSKDRGPQVLASQQVVGGS